MDETSRLLLEPCLQIRDGRLCWAIYDSADNAQLVLVDSFEDAVRFTETILPRLKSIEEVQRMYENTSF